MRKLLFLLSFAFAVTCANAATITTTKLNTDNHISTSHVVKKKDLSTADKAKLEALKKATLCSFDYYVFADCPDGSYDLYGHVTIVYWCETGVINTNLSMVSTVIPDCWTMTI